MSLLSKLQGPQRRVDTQKWAGPKRPYDLVKEFAAVFGVVTLLVVALAAAFSSPDEKAATMKTWVTHDAADFAQTAATELAGTSGTATYGGPYNNNGDGQALGPLKIQKLVGVHIPINTVEDFVLNPLSMSGDPAVQRALVTWKAASADQQSTWANDYATAMAVDATATSVADPGGKYGPVPELLSGLASMAASGTLDGALITADGPMTMNYTKELLFLADSGTYFPSLGENQHLGGDQWGMINELGKYPGQPWLIPVSFWYQIEPFKSSDNADILILALVGVIAGVTILMPFIPGVRRIPMLVPIHRLIWRDYYRKQK
jgi:hypothetical protein